MENSDYNIKSSIGVQRINPDGQRQLSYYHQQQNKGKSASHKLRDFRQGEIVQGRILSIIERGLGVVRLPNGDFKCYLHEGLLADDELFFKITETSPSLVLKVYAVQSHSQGKRRLSEDIIRVLDLPNNNLYSYSSELFLNFKNMIFKDDFLRFYKFYSKIPKDVKYDTKSVSQALFWMSESDLLFEYSLFEVAYNYFDLLQKIDGLMELFFNQYAKQLPDTVVNLIDGFSKKYYEDIEPDNFKFDFFSLHSDSDEFCFYKLISRLSNYRVGDSPNNVVVQIKDFIEAMNDWAGICSTGESPFHWTFPFRVKGKTKLITIIFRSEFSISKMKRTDERKYDIEIGILLTNIFRNEADEFLKDISQAQDIERLSYVFSKYMSRIGLELLSINYFDNNELVIISSPVGATINTNKAISFVV